MGKPGVVGVYTNQRFNLSKLWEGSRRICQGLKPVSGNPTDRHFRGASRTVRHGEIVNPPAIERAGPETPHLQRGALDLYPNGAADKAESLAGCKSPYRQLPVFGRLAYPMRGEATNRVLLGRKSPGCPAAVFAAVGLPGLRGPTRGPQSCTQATRRSRNQPGLCRPAVRVQIEVQIEVKAAETDVGRD